MSIVSIILYVVGGIIFLLPNFYAGWRFEKGIESDLLAESDSYSGISKHYRNYALFWSIFAIFILFIIWKIIEDGSGQMVEILMALFIVIVTSSFTTISGIFAIQRNVYPTSKYYGRRTTFAYDYDGNVKKYGRMVTTVTGSIAIISMLSIVLIRFFT